MKNRKAILLLLLAILVVVALELILDYCPVVRPQKAQRTLVESDFDCTSVTILHRDAEPIVLEKEDVWRLVKPYSVEVDEQEVLRLLDAISFAQVQESISDAELLRLGRTRADFALEDPRMTLILSNKTSAVSFSLGLPTPSGDGVYVALAGRSSVLIVPSSVLAAVDVPAERFRPRQLVRVRAEAIGSFSIRRSATSRSTFLLSGETWMMDGRKASQAVVRKFLTDLTTATVTRFVWPTGETQATEEISAARLSGYGLDADSATTVTLSQAGGRDVLVSFGKTADADSVYAFVHGGSTIVSVPVALKDAALREEAAFVDQRLFSRAAEKVAAISIASEDRTISLARASTGAWRLEAPISAPADGEATAALCARLTALTSASVDPSGVSVSIDSLPVVRVRRSSVFPEGTPPETLRSRVLAAFPATEIRRLVVTSGETTNTSCSVVYSVDRRAWNIESAPEGMVVSDAGVATVLKALSDLRAVRVEKLRVSAEGLAAYGLDRPFLTLAVDLNRAETLRRNILIGSELEDGARFATIGSADAIFILSRETIDALLVPLVTKE